jgi:hypothetical protein
MSRRRSRRAWARGAAAALVAAALGLAPVGCKRPPAAAPPASARPALGEVTVRDQTPGDNPPAAVDTGALQDGIRARLMASGLFVAAPDGGAEVGAGAVVRARCDVALDAVEVAGKALARAVVRLRLDTRPSDAPGALEEDLQGQGEQVYVPVAAKAGATVAAKTAASRPKRAAADAQPERDARFAKLVLRVAGDLIDGFAAREKLRTATPREIHDVLISAGGELRQEAIRLVGERRLTDEAPLLLKLLDDQSEVVRDAALGALIQLGDRRAVPVLTRSRSLRDSREMRKILDAVSVLGGEEALDYLSFVADSHDDEEVRDLAKAAKSRLERRMKEGAANP